MPMIPGTTAVADGTLSGELYLALDGLDAEVAADTFRRALCEAFGIAIATHANETIVEGGGTYEWFEHLGYEAPSPLINTEAWVPVVNPTAGVLPNSATVTNATFYLPFDCEVVEVMARASSNMGSTVMRLFRDGSQVDSDTQTMGLSTNVTFAVGASYTTGQYFGISLDPTNNHASVSLVVRFRRTI